MSVFAMRTDDIGQLAHGDVGHKLLLANISIKFTIIAELPKVPYQTICDHFIFICFFTQALISHHEPDHLLARGQRALRPRLLESEEFEIFGLAMKRSKDMIANIVCGLLCVLIMASLALWLFWKLHFYNKDVLRWVQNSLPWMTLPRRPGRFSVGEQRQSHRRRSCRSTDEEVRVALQGRAAGRIGPHLSDGRVAPMPASPSAGVTRQGSSNIARFSRNAKKGNALNMHEQGFDARAVESMADYRKRRDDA